MTDKITIEKVRSILFPAIGLDIITGFNIYDVKHRKTLEAPDKGSVKVKVRYMHTDLKKGDDQYDKLIQVIKGFSDVERILEISYRSMQPQVISRLASYRMQRGWTRPELKYQLIDQREIGGAEAAERLEDKETVIGMDDQPELVFECEVGDLEKLLLTLRKEANKFVIDPRDGRPIVREGMTRMPLGSEELENYYKKAEGTWDEAWDVPFISLIGANLAGAEFRKTYVPAQFVNFDLPESFGSILIGDKYDTDTKSHDGREMIPSLLGHNENRLLFQDPMRTFVNRVLYDWMDEVNWERVKKTRESYM